MSAMETADLFRGAYLLTQGGRLVRTRVVRGQVLFVIEGKGWPNTTSATGWGVPWSTPCSFARR